MPVQGNGVVVSCGRKSVKCCAYSGPRARTASRIAARPPASHTARIASAAPPTNITQTWSTSVITTAPSPPLVV